MTNKVDSNFQINKNIRSGHQIAHKQNVAPIDRTPYQKLERVYRSQGLIGKFIDSIKGTFGQKYSHRSLENDILNRNFKNIDSKLDKYYDRQKNETEMVLDLATGVTAAGTFRFARKAMAVSHAYLPKGHKAEKIALLASAGISAISGMIIKPILKGINSLDTPKQERKRERSVVKDIATGFLDGASAPLMYLHKLGILAAVGINSLSRFVFNKKTDKDSNFIENISSSWLVKIPLLGAAGYSVFKHHKGVDKIEKAILKSKENIKNIQNWGLKMPMSELVDLGKTNLSDKKTQNDLFEATRKGFFSKWYNKLTKPLNIFRRNHPVLQTLELSAKPAKRIMFENKELIKEKEMTNIMREIEQYNIFYPKMLQSLPSNIREIGKLMLGEDKQIAEKINSAAEKDSKPKGWLARFIHRKSKYISDKGLNNINSFLNNYKSKCPSSRTVDEAQEVISKTFGDKYKIQGKEPIGVGTIAESYLAKYSSGKEVVIKMTKKWATLEKLQNDKEKMLSVLKRMRSKMTKEEYNYQCTLVDDLYKAWSKEVDMQLEADAAELLGKHAKHYNTVAPIEVKNNIFIMEKANGVQFDKFVEYLNKNNKKLSMDELTELSVKYVQVFMEQLLSVPKTGNKVMHADPHVGNIFIDINNKEKPFTFIDTGNVMRFTPEEAIANVTSHLDYFIGNSQSIAKRLTKGAKLPEGMTEKQAVDILAKHLQETFFSGKYAAKGGGDPFSTINNEALEFMKKNRVIINPQNSNLTKAEWTYILNLLSLGGIQKHVDLNSVIDEEKSKQLGIMLVNQVKESIINGAINNKKATFKEVYSRLKFIEENPEDFFTSLYSWVKPKN